MFPPRCSVSGFPPPPCNARAARHDAAHIRDVELHIWSTIWLKLRDRGAGSMSRSERGGGVAGAMKPRAGSWRNPMRRARSCRRWRAGTTSRRSICSLGGRRHAVGLLSLPADEHPRRPKASKEGNVASVSDIRSGVLSGPKRSRHADLCRLGGRQPPVDRTPLRPLSRRPARQPPRPRLLGCQSLKEPRRYADPHWRSGGGRGGLLLIAPPK